MNERVKICFFIGSFQTGGAEYLLLNTIRYLDKKKFKPFLCVFSENGELREEYKKLNLKIKKFDVNTKFKAFTEFFRFIRFLRKNKIEVIHIHLVGTFLFSISGALISGVKKRILHWHNIYERERSKYYSVKIGSMFATNILAISKIVSERNCRIYKIKKSKVNIVYNAIDTSAYELNQNNHKKNFQKHL